MARFYLQFDKAFLGLYPDFVTEFAKLLKPGNEVSLNTDGSMTTELRIFAFIRLGVTESSEIATLLSYSPHTIYNYRSAMKAKAVDKEHFEENVRNLCHPS
jgi:tRNA G46 methylase TrmB